MAEKLLTLTEWAEVHYGKSAPCKATLYSWAAKGKIFPAPEKHGKSYRVQASAVYREHKPQGPSLLDRLIEDRIKHGTKAA